MGDIRMQTSLNIKDVRKEQRRVAALLGNEPKLRVQEQNYVYSPRNVHICTCTRLVQCNHPSHNFLREGLENVTARSKHKTKDASKRRHSIDSGDLLKRDVNDVGGGSMTSRSRSPTIVQGLSNSKLSGAIKRGDIEGFDYKKLRDDIVQKELGGPDSLPTIHRNNNYANQKRMHVPDNSPSHSRQGHNKKVVKLPNISKPKNHNGVVKVVFTKSKSRSKRILMNGAGSTSQDYEDDFDARFTHSATKHVGGRNMYGQSDVCTCSQDVIDNYEAQPTKSNTSGYSSGSPKAAEGKPGEKTGKSLINSSKDGGTWCGICGRRRVSKSPTRGHNRNDSGHTNLNSDSFVSNTQSSLLSIQSLSSGSFVRLQNEFEDDFKDSYQASGYPDDYGIETCDSADLIRQNKEGNFQRETESNSTVFEPSRRRKNRSKSRKQRQSKLEVTVEEEELNNPSTESKETPNESSGFKKANLNSNKIEIYENGYKEAYDKALYAAQVPKLPLDTFMLSLRLTKPFEFSYFEPNPYPRHCGDCDKYHKEKPLSAHKAKKVKPMKHVFGKLELNDFYPGGKKNPLALRKSYS